MIVSSKQGAVTILSVESALNAELAEDLKTAANSLPKLGRPQLVIDLASTPLIDSAGCEALLDIHDKAVDIGGECCLSSPSPLCRDILAVSGLDQQMLVFDGSHEAVASFAR